MFRRLFGKRDEPIEDFEPEDTDELVPRLSIQITTDTVDEPYERSEWVDPRNSSWRDYEEFFFKDKTWYRDTPQWRQVLRVCHAHWNLDRAISETYYRREIDGVEPTIPLCREQISIAPQAKVALEMHEKFQYDYQTKEIEREKLRWKKNGWGDYTGWEPILRPFNLPAHSGFKQLAIIYDKMKDYEAAIEVCKEALAVDWPGDWDVRIARYEKRLATANKKSKQKSPVSGNVVTIEPVQPPMRPRFCDQCGNELEGDAKFCPQCGSKIE